MVAMQFSCPHCGGLFQVDSSLGGQQVSCPHCRNVVVLPAMASQPLPGLGTAQDPAGTGGGTPGPWGQEMPVRPPGQLPGFPQGGQMPAQTLAGPERPLAPTPNLAPQPRMPSSQERPLTSAPTPAPGVPPQPRGAGQERPRPGPQAPRPLRPMPLGAAPASATPGQERPLGSPSHAPTPPTGAGDRVSEAARSGGGVQMPGIPPSAPKAPAVPTTPRPRPAGVEPQMPSAPVPAAPRPAAPGRPEVPLSSPTPLGEAPAGTARLPMTGPQPTVAALGGVESLLPPGPAADATVRPRGGGVGPQTAFSPPNSGTTVPQPASGLARPIVLPTPDGGVVRLREPAKTVGAGDDALELRSRSAVQKEVWRFKKNLIIWLIGLVLLCLTIAILMLLGPIPK